MESRMREIRTYGLGRQEAGNRFLTFIEALCGAISIAVFTDNSEVQF